MTPAQMEAIRPTLEDIARGVQRSIDAYHTEKHCLVCGADVPQGSHYNRPRHCESCLYTHMRNNRKTRDKSKRKRK